MLSIDAIYHIKALHRLGLTTREIAAALKINRESVLKYIKQPVIIRSPPLCQNRCQLIYRASNDNTLSTRVA